VTCRRACGPRCTWRWTSAVRRGGGSWTTPGTSRHVIRRDPLPKMATCPSGINTRLRLRPLQVYLRPRALQVYTHAYDHVPFRYTHTLTTTCPSGIHTRLRLRALQVHTHAHNYVPFRYTHTLRTTCPSGAHICLRLRAL
jgi:hypothetical protein